MRVRRVSIVLFAGGLATLAAGLPVGGAPAPRAGAACTARQVGQRSGALLCTRVGTRTQWRAVPTTTSAPATTAAPAPTAPAPTAAPATTARPVEIRKVNVTSSAVFTGLPQIVAIEKGLDKKNGLELRTVNVASGADIARAQLSGDVDIAVNSPPNIIALLDQDVDVVVFGQGLAASQFDIVVRADYATPNASKGWQGAMKDLAGARIGVIARGVAAEEVIRSLFRLAGVDPDKQTYIATGLTATTIAALTNKQIDAAINVEPTISLAIRNNLGKSPFALRRGDGPDLLRWPGTYYTATRGFATKNPEVLRSYLAMTNDALNWIADPANKAELYKIMKDKIAADSDLADTLLIENKGTFPKTAEVNVATVQAFLDWANATGNSLKRRKPADFLLKP